MRSIYKIVVCSLLTLSITSCEKDLLEKEQYQKEIYLIGAYNRVWTTEVSYSNEEVKTYFTVSSSGTLALDRDVNVKMKINEELVDIYNKKYWTVLNEDKYYKSLDTDLYSIPSLENTVIKHAEGISAEVPVLIKTASLKIDQSYVIPVEIESTTGYPIFSANSTPSGTLSTTREAATGSPIFSMVALNSRRSSAFLIVSDVVPIRRTLFSFKNPASSSSMARFSPAWPPSVGRILSGFSLRISSSTTSTVRGSM